VGREFLTLCRTPPSADTLLLPHAVACGPGRRTTRSSFSTDMARLFRLRQAFAGSRREFFFPPRRVGVRIAGRLSAGLFWRPIFFSEQVPVPASRFPGAASVFFFFFFLSIDARVTGSDETSIWSFATLRDFFSAPFRTHARSFFSSPLGYRG